MGPFSRCTRFLLLLLWTLPVVALLRGPLLEPDLASVDGQQGRTTRTTRATRTPALRYLELGSTLPTDVLNPSAGG